MPKPLAAAAVGCALIAAITPAPGAAQVPPMRAADLDFERGGREIVDLFGTAIFWRDGGGVLDELWRSDATEAGTFLLASRRAAFSVASQWGRLVRAGNCVYFSSTDALTGAELWKTDGTVAGTAIVRDLLPNQTSSDPLDLTPVGNRLFFTARTVGLGERELFVSDGTFGGTVMVKDIVPGPAGSFPRLLTAWKGRLYFIATGQLWASDGTEAGTAPVAPVGTPITRMDPQSDHLYLSGGSSSRQRELWSSDGTAAGTQRLGTWAVDSREEISPLVEKDGEVFFSFEGPAGHAEIWSTDGSPAGTRLEVGTNTSLSSFYPLDNGILFQRNDPDTGTEPWIHDRSSGTSSLLLDVVPGTGSSNARVVLPVGDGVLFSAFGGFVELWFTDGTTAATEQVGPSFYNSPFAVGSRQVWFEGGGKLWSTDGTVTGTVEEFAGGTTGDFVLAGPNVLFFHRDTGPPAGYDLWKINPGAQARSIGHADADGSHQARTSASDPVFGSTSRWSIDGMPGGAAYAMVLGFPSAQPTFVPFASYLDPGFAVVVLSGFTPASGGVDLDVRIPDRLELRNAELMLQTWWFGRRVNGTNGVLLVIGE